MGFDREEPNHFVPSRISVWCPVCGATEGHGCSAVNLPRFSSHDAYALGQVPRPQVQMEAAMPMARDSARRPEKWTPKTWTQ